MHLIQPLAGETRPPTLDPPPYLAPVFDHADLLKRALEIRDLLADEDQDASLSLLALLSRQYGGWSGRICDAAGWMLLHEQEFTAAAPWEARAAA